MEDKFLTTKDIGNYVNISSNQEDDGNISIQSDTDYFKEMFYFSDIFNEYEYKKFIKNIESIIRKSREYTNYIDILKEENPIMRVDNILSNISDTDAKIELHHYPFTLYDVIDIVVSYHIMRGELCNTQTISKEVMEMHYQNIIGLVPMTTTIHELTHNGSIFLSTKQIYGEWEIFMDKYESAMTDEMKYKIKQIKEYSKSDTKSDLLGLFD